MPSDAVIAAILAALSTLGSAAFAWHASRRDRSTRRDVARIEHEVKVDHGVLEGLRQSLAGVQKLLQACETRHDERDLHDERNRALLQQLASRMGLADEA